MGRTRGRKKRKWRFMRYTILSLVGISTYSFFQNPNLVGFINSSSLVERIEPLRPTDPLGHDRIQPEVEPVTKRVDLSQTHSPNVILIDFETGERLAEKASSEIVFPASLTKLMTVAVALDYLTELDQEVVMQEKYFTGLFEARASITGFVEDEVTTVRELLYGAILPSGADACLALADLIAGSEADFVTLMNEKARELGMTRTRYANATGLHDVKNISTVEDIAKLVHRVSKNPVFYEVFTTLQHEVPATNFNEEGFIMNSTIYNSLMKLPELQNVIIGGKTGFTEQAGLCLASIGEVGGKKYILVTAGADAIPDFPIDQDRPIEEPLHLQDAADIYGQLMGGIDLVSDY